MDFATSLVRVVTSPMGVATGYLGKLTCLVGRLKGLSFGWLKMHDMFEDHHGNPHFTLWKIVFNTL